MQRRLLSLAITFSHSSRLESFLKLVDGRDILAGSAALQYNLQSEADAPPKSLAGRPIKHPAFEATRRGSIVRSARRRRRPINRFDAARRPSILASGRAVNQDVGIPSDRSDRAVYEAVRAGCSQQWPLTAPPVEPSRA